MCATLTRSSSVLTRPAYSSMSFGLVPAASTRLGLSISCGIAATLHGHAMTMETTKLGTAERQPHLPRHDAHGRQDASRRGPPDARPLRRGRREVPRHRRRLRRRRVRAHARSVAGLAARRGRRGHEGPHEGLRPAGRGLAPDRIRAACDASLRRLGIDVIDLYQVHAPDPETPLEETLEALDGLVRPARCARSARRTTRPGCSRGPFAAGPQRLGAVRLAPAAVLAGGALGRGRDPAVLPRRRDRADPVGPARSRLPHGQVLARHRAARGFADGRGGRRHRGGAPPPRGRAQLPGRRRGGGDRLRAGATISRSRWRG